MKTEIVHFTEVPEIQHSNVEKAGKNDNAYGITWGNLVREYLKTAYSSKETQSEVISDGVTYKVLRRKQVTAFYDVQGSTLFDVENQRLEKEYALIKNGGSKEGVKTYDSGEDKLIAEEEEMISSVKPEFKKVMRAQMDLIFQELIRWTKQDSDFEKKVLLSHKSMKRCMKFCTDKAMRLREPSDQEKADARNHNIPIMTPVGSDMVFEWIQEYYNLDDKAEAEKEKKTAEKKMLRDKKTAEKKEKPAKGKKLEEQAFRQADEKEAVPRVPHKGKSRHMDGQLSMFDFINA